MTSAPLPHPLPLFSNARPWRGGITQIVVKDDALAKNPSKNIVWK